jgi:hypothetical protein
MQNFLKILAWTSIVHASHQKGTSDRSITSSKPLDTTPKTTYAGMAIAVWGGSDDIRRMPSLKLLLMIAPHGCCSLYGKNQNPLVLFNGQNAQEK